MNIKKRKGGNNMRYNSDLAEAYGDEYMEFLNNITQLDEPRE